MFDRGIDDSFVLPCIPLWRCIWTRNKGIILGSLRGILVKNLNVLLNYFIKQQLKLRLPDQSYEIFMDNMQILFRTMSCTIKKIKYLMLERSRWMNWVRVEFVRNNQNIKNNGRYEIMWRFSIRCPFNSQCMHM